MEKGKNILKLKDVVKRYGTFTALDHINMTIDQGGIYGLIGKNGAGKTTLMRIIAGLSYMDEGEMALFGETKSSKWDALRRKMSFIVETPYLTPGLTAYENMNRQRLIRGIKNEKCIEEKLELVGLIDVKNKKAGDYSLGMRQRLGIAMAMLSDPSFLILDEPTNGLDPIAILEMRELILRLNQVYQTTLLISTHILEELYHVATDYIMIDQGKVLRSISLSELNAYCNETMVIGVREEEKAIQVLQALGYIAYEMIGDKKIKIRQPIKDIYQLSEALVSGGVGLSYLAEEKMTLEQYFIELVGKGEQNGTDH